MFILPRVIPASDELFVGMRNAAEFHGDSRMEFTNPSDTSDPQTSTLSFWYRRVADFNKIGGHYLLDVGDQADFPRNATSILLLDSRELNLRVDIAGTSEVNLITNSATNGFYEDFDWHHVVARLNLGPGGVGADKARLYVDGVEPDLRVATRPTGDGVNHQVFSTLTHYLGRWQGTSTDTHLEGLMGDVNLVDGQSLGPGEFGEFDGPDWVWKNYTGTHGTNGRRYEFKAPANLGLDTSA